MKKLNVKTVLSSHWGDGGKGAVDLAKIVVELCENSKQKMQYAYEDKDTLIEKINKVAKKIYRASEVTMDDKVKAQIQNLQDTQVMDIFQFVLLKLKVLFQQIQS